MERGAPGAGGRLGLALCPRRAFAGFLACVPGGPWGGVLRGLGSAQPLTSRAWPHIRILASEEHGILWKAAKGFRFTQKGLPGARSRGGHTRVPRAWGATRGHGAQPIPPQPGFRPGRKEQEFGMF